MKNNEENFFKVFSTEEYQNVLVVLISADTSSAVRLFIKSQDRVIECSVFFDEVDHEMRALEQYNLINDDSISDLCTRMVTDWIEQIKDSEELLH